MTFSVTVARGQWSYFKYDAQGRVVQIMDYDFGARHYDPRIARWEALDPLAEDYEDLSPYNYVANSPLNNYDPDGAGIEDGIVKPCKVGGGGGGIGPYAEVVGALAYGFKDLLGGQADIALDPRYSIKRQPTNVGAQTPGSGSGPGDGEKKKIQKPGFGESLIPVWGEGKASLSDYQHGMPWWGTFHMVVAVSDVFLVRALGSAIIKTGAKIGTKLLIKEVVDEGGRMAAKGGVSAIEAGEYTITKTVANNLSTRPYINSPSTIKNIMSTGKGVPDAFFKGGVNYKVPGTFQGSKGIFELGINPEKNIIYHFLFKH